MRAAFFPWRCAALPKSRLSARKPSFHFVRPRLELLEDRCVLSTITVNSAADIAAPPAGTVTLRSAITQAETDFGVTLNGDTINFAASLTGQTITLASALPTLGGEETLTCLRSHALTISGNNRVRGFRARNPTRATAISH